MSVEYAPLVAESHKKIATYWRARRDDWDIACEWDEAHLHCWRCGYRRRLERAHITPRTDNKMHPKDLVLLCVECHDEAPNVTDRDAMWTWIVNRPDPSERLYKLMGTLETLHGVSLEDVARICHSDEALAVFHIALKDAKDKVGIHRGVVSDATVAWMINQALQAVMRAE